VKANPRFINHVDPPATVTYSQFGEAQVELGGQTILAVSGYRQVSVMVGSTQAATVSLVVGKIAGATLAMEHSWPPDFTIHTFDVVAPEIAVWLKGGKPGATEQVQVWMYLRP
jgi:hypothetical protein